MIVVEGHIDDVPEITFHWLDKVLESQAWTKDSDEHWSGLTKTVFTRFFHGRCSAASDSFCKRFLNDKERKVFWQPFWPEISQLKALSKDHYDRLYNYRAHVFSDFGSKRLCSLALTAFIATREADTTDLISKKVLVSGCPQLDSKCTNFLHLLWGKFQLGDLGHQLRENRYTNLCLFAWREKLDIDCSRVRDEWIILYDKASWHILTSWKWYVSAAQSGFRVKSCDVRSTLDLSKFFNFLRCSGWF